MRGQEIFRTLSPVMLMAVQDPQEEKAGARGGNIAPHPHTTEAVLPSVVELE